MDSTSEFLEQMTHHKFSIVLETQKDDDGSWLCSGTVLLSVSRDGEHWGTQEMSVKSIEDSPNSGFVTIFSAMVQQMQSDEFSERLKEGLLLNESNPENT